MGKFNRTGAIATKHVSKFAIDGAGQVAPKEGRYEYAVNRRAFDTMLETMRVKDGKP